MRFDILAGDEDLVSEEFFTQHRDFYWRQLFHIEKLETASRHGSRTFAYEILTNGKAVSVVLERPNPVSTAEEFNDDDLDCLRYPYQTLHVQNDQMVWGMDPGQRDLFHAVNGDGEHMACSNKQYYHDAR